MREYCPTVLYLDLRCRDDDVIQVSDLHDGLIGGNRDGSYNETKEVHCDSTALANVYIHT